MKLVLTCEHAAAEIPSEYSYLFNAEKYVLNTHEAFDPGAFDLFQYLKPLSHFRFYHSIGRLLVEVNRSEHHPKLFSRYSKKLDKDQKKLVKQYYYFPYRKQVEEQIGTLTGKGIEVLHISVHSFTPVLNGQERNCDLGLLYDPSRKKESSVCRKMKELIRENNSDLVVRMNYPYLGKADGFTTYLRKKFGENYMGIELEVNQKFVSKNSMDKRIKSILKIAIQQLLQ
ncbi:N-formylglutamate amidohydrolase [Christiangramia fulva]|uniref:N-formylglutamate amidohydrolase n=1 Tax=Christiangramia fulva TaxID=2126553 RepID=A0A2R3Z7W3_9FLAO|nr:N-formylglutamate amidohydrolase [Christiangramia fulva]AVR46322.1 N-formylglutamate amidohydrolase [Christiangramia fulva]